MNDRSTDDLRVDYDATGLAIARGAIDADLAREMVAHVHWLGKRHPGVRPEQLHHHLLVDDPFLHRLAGDPRLLDIAQQFVGPDVALFAAHYIAKPPHSGQAVPWHQDGSYWPLEPMEVTTLWVAGTASTRENGCMRVLPGTHHEPLVAHGDLVAVDAATHVLPEGLDPAAVDATDAVDVELAPGDVSVHDPRLIHGSDANTSGAWRVGLTLRYIPTSTRVLNRQHRCVLLRGDADPGAGNTHAKRPRWVRGAHMAFAGCEDWR